METYVILRRSGWRTADDLRVAAERSTVEGERMSDDVRWIRSYVTAETDGRVGTVCIYQASSPEAIRRHACRRPAGRRDREGRRHRARQTRPCPSRSLKRRRHMRKTLLIALAAAIPLLAVAGYAAAGGQSKLADVRDATAAFHDLGTAKDA